MAWDHLKHVVQPLLRHKAPMSGPGDTLEVATDLKLEQLRSVVRNSRWCAGMEYSVRRPAPQTLTTSTVWKNL